MNMTHYMELLATNQPWNLILFMVIPVVLAETVAVTELFVLLKKLTTGWVVTLNKTASIIGGTYFIGVFGYLMTTAVIPLTTGGSWRGPGDVIAVGGYLSGIIPLVGMALLDVGLVGRQWDASRKTAVHASLVALFLVVAHIAMIFGMLDPTLLRATAAPPAMEHMHGHN